MSAYYYDIDGTILLWPGPDPASRKHAKANGGEPTINEKAVAQITDHLAAGDEVYLWSSRGSEAAKDVARKLKIVSKVAGCLSKPDVIVSAHGDWWKRVKTSPA